MNIEIPRDNMLARAIRILDVFDPDHPRLAVAEIARRTGLPSPTAYRLVNELISHGLLTRTVDHRVQIGLRLWELASRTSEATRLIDIAAPFVDDLYASLREHTFMSVLEGVEVLHIRRQSAPGSMVISDVPTAGRLPAHACSSGHVLLAHAASELLGQAMMPPLEALTSHTVTDPEQLRRRLADVRHRGYAVDHGGVRDNATGISAPVRGPNGDVIAAITVIQHREESQITTVVPALLATSRSITRALGAAPRSVAVGGSVARLSEPGRRQIS